MRQGFWKYACAATLLSLLVGCAALPSPSTQASEDSGSVPADVATATAPAPAPARPLSKRFLERLLKPLVLTEVLAPPVVQAEPEVDERYRLTGEVARELERGDASWYGPRFHGRLTANGERFDKYALTAAHKTLPFGTIVRVRSIALGLEVDVRINDRGPFAPGRVIDVSEAAAEAIGLTTAGVAEVSLNVAESTLEAVDPAVSGLQSPNKPISRNGRKSSSSSKTRIAR